MTIKWTSISNAIMVYRGKLICWAFSWPSDNKYDCYTAVLTWMIGHVSRH